MENYTAEYRTRRRYDAIREETIDDILLDIDNEITRLEGIKMRTLRLMERVCDEHDRAVAHLQDQIDSADKPTMNSTEVKRLLGICSTTLWEWEKKGKIRYTKAGKKKIYDTAEVKSLMQK